MGKVRISRPRYKRKKQRGQTNRTGSKSRFEHGIYQIINEEKYIPTYNKMSQGFPEYRSSWEKKAMKFFDTNKEIVKWASEPVKIPYYNPKENTIRNYYPDFYIEFSDGRKFIVEVKPLSQTTDVVVQAKAKAAIEWCVNNHHNINFIFLTEKELGV